MNSGIPFFGTLIICAVLVAAAYTLSVSLYASRGGLRYLHAGRCGAYATCALVAVAVCLLAYAFQTHDFRIRYVARYSDRSMPWWYLITSLWGGQDGSLLWWSFLLSGYTAACVFSLKQRYLQLQPYIIATLMSILIFFSVVMLFAANPFNTAVSVIPPDGEGLNPLLQNYWMIIHPPTLYMGFVGWSVPFAFVIAALATGRLREEWIYASRRWVLIAWLCLAVGNLLGALWSYEELGWGGYWAWDPVENAAFMPLLSGTAFLHSVMIQERRGMMRVWNVFLLCLTFIMTIFGTFLTRSGLIASVHSFAKSDIGIYFVYYLFFLLFGCFILIFWRLPRLKAQAHMDSYLSREFAFLANNWILLGMQLFVVIATTFPLISEALRDETVTVGPGYYNKWMVPLGLILLFLTGVGPLIAWRKATGKNLLRAFTKPALFGLSVAGLHLVFGNGLGIPPFIGAEDIYDTATGRILASIYGVMPLCSFALCAFVLATIIQEFWRGTAVRRKNTNESVFTALIRMVSKAKRRYGGYLVHLSIVAMFIGFSGAAYDQDQEAALRPGEEMQVGGYVLRYDHSRMEVDPNKRMLFTDMTLRRNGKKVARLSPAKFIYKTHPQMPTTEVAIYSTPVSDVYVVMNSVNPSTKVGTFKMIVRPLVMWIWLGGLLLIFGTLVAISPSIKELLGDVRLPRGKKSLAVGLSTLLILCVAFVFTHSANAQSDGTSSLHAGSVSLKNKQERKLFERLLCGCGDCARLPLSTCACGWAEDMRKDLRQRLNQGHTIQQIQTNYREQFGVKAIAIPSDKGLDRALWAVPIAALVLAAFGLFWLGGRWKRRGNNASLALGGSIDPGPTAARGEATLNTPSSDTVSLNDRLDEELKRMDDDQ